jgi:hypothetical protein
MDSDELLRDVADRAVERADYLAPAELPKRAGPQR